MPKTVYLCTLCASQHDTEKEALACEKSHPMGEALSVVAVSGYERRFPEMVELANKAGETATYRLWVERSKRAPGWLDEKGAALEVELPGGGFEPAPQEKG
jgi:hypothetical protein